MSKRREFHIDFIGHQKIYYTISITLMVITLLVSLIFGVKMDIQFKGGTIANYTYSGELDANAVQSTVKDTLKQEVNVQDTVNAGTGEKSIVVTVASKNGITVEEQTAMTDALQKTYKDNELQLSSTNSVDPTTGREFFEKCLVAVAFSFLVLIVYIALRFKRISGWSAGVMSVLALLHDAIMVYATFVIFRIPLNDNFMAVVLTILGYSINDTIIIYDRLRENKKVMPAHTPVAELMNKSINQTLGRTINTSITTITVMVVVCVVALIFHIDSILSFAFPLIIGMISGTYSTLCIAGPLWVKWQLFKEKRSKTAKKAKA